MCLSAGRPNTPNEPPQRLDVPAVSMASSGMDSERRGPFRRISGAFRLTLVAGFLLLGLQSSVLRAGDTDDKKEDATAISSEIVFNVQTPRTEPLLCVPDYLAWTVQRVFERGETRHYDFVRERISLVVDLYDAEKYEGSRNYYTPQRPLTAENKLGPPVS